MEVVSIDNQSAYNEDQYLILIFNQTSQQWNDSTSNVVSIQDSFYYGKKSGYLITYIGGKTYPYNRDSVQIYRNPTIIDIVDKTISIDGSIYLLAYKVLKFSRFYKVFFVGNKTKLTTNLEVRKQEISSEPNIFMYYKQLAHYASQIQVEEESVQGFVSSQYNYIYKIDSQSILKAYMRKTFRSYDDVMSIIFPFNFNISQKKAVGNALKNQVSIIEGPPGCGKTQTILNLITNLIINNKTIAVVSNNNTAIKNVSDKLTEEGIGFLCALLGNKENKSIFFENITNETIKSFIENYDFNLEKPNEKFTLYYYSDLLDKYHEKENLRAKLTLEIDNLIKEYQYFKFKHEEVITFYSNLKIKKLRSHKYLNLKAYFELKRKISMIDRIILRWSYRIRISKFKSLEHFSILMENMFYLNREKEIEKMILDIDVFLSKNKFDDIKKEYISESKKHLNQALYKKFKNLDDVDISAGTLSQEFDKFILRYPIILSTSHSLLTNIKDGFMFDYLIVDEASQSDLLSSVLAMGCAKNIVVVGDSKQLDQIDDQDIYDASDKLAKDFNIGEEFLYRNNSLLGAFKKVFPNAPTTLLKEHYRCHPTIINFINQRFYNNELIVLTKYDDKKPITLLQLVEGNHARRNPDGSGQYNQREIDEVIEFIKTNSFEDIGIISPFRIQVQMYMDALDNLNDIEVDTVHKFQGRQKKTIILSTVVNDIQLTEKNERLIDFINNPKLFNVALSRAQNHVVLVGTQGLFESSNNNFSDFIKYSLYNTNESSLITGRITSVFDLLYSNYTTQLNELIVANKKDKLIASELIIYSLLIDILKDYNNLKFAMHVSLAKLINNFDIFDEHEKRYLKNHLTHVDFIIYNSLTKENLLAIEVDGIKYHQQSSLQTTRDEIKSKAFEYNHLKLIRLATNQSNEKTTIKSSLDAILSRH